MDNILQIAKDYATIINSVLLIILLFKYALDIRKQRLEYEKLERELKALRDREYTAAQTVIVATEDDMKRYVIGPLVKAIDRRNDELRNGYNCFLQQTSKISESMKEFVERSMDGHEFSCLIVQNIEAIKRLTKYLEHIEEHETKKKKVRPDTGQDC